MPMSEPRLVVTAHEPGRRRRALLVMALLAALVAWALFAVGQRVGGYQHGAASDVRSALEDELSAAVAENETLRRELAETRTSAEVNEEARQLLRDDLADLQSQVAELNGELDFYRDIMGPGDGREGLHIRSVEMEPAGDRPGRWRLQVVLTQLRKHDHRATGSMSMIVEGRQGAETVRLNVEDLTDQEDELVYGFRYFQTIERDLSFPDGFTPQRVVVTLKPREKGTDPITGSYDWNEPRS
mgnify:FL=1